MDRPVSQSFQAKTVSAALTAWLAAETSSSYAKRTFSPSQRSKRLFWSRAALYAGLNRFIGHWGNSRNERWRRRFGRLLWQAERQKKETQKQKKEGKACGGGTGCVRRLVGGWFRSETQQSGHLDDQQKTRAEDQTKHVAAVALHPQTALTFKTKI